VHILCPEQEFTTSKNLAAALIIMLIPF